MLGVEASSPVDRLLYDRNHLTGQPGGAARCLVRKNKWDAASVPIFTYCKSCELLGTHSFKLGPDFPGDTLELKAVFVGELAGDGIAVEVF